VFACGLVVVVVVLDVVGVALVAGVLLEAGAWAVALEPPLVPLGVLPRGVPPLPLREPGVCLTAERRVEPVGPVVRREVAAAAGAP
jgi:hypothetical protein